VVLACGLEAFDLLTLCVMIAARLSMVVVPQQELVKESV
jgi:hypothetical protein